VQALPDGITGMAEGRLFRHGYGDSHAHVGMPVPYGTEARALEAQLLGQYWRRASGRPKRPPAAEGIAGPGRGRLGDDCAAGVDT
jgi:hypothetical protein